ncbi:DASH complex subunit dam1 [Paramarasmius palmivorus]|uniref:DASH complex subunit DAM1 n=1 Tax=Paramarasmius palmivorus TaxID=297713 RepID=A0AAW0E422_9AGAR
MSRQSQLPAPPTTPHKTPLRRVSQGSLFALSRSGAYPDAPHGLGFLEPAMSEFTDEIDTLQANVEGMKRLSDSLGTFNESFASWLYIMDMNALTTDWPQAPNDASFELFRRREERDALAAIEAEKAKFKPPLPSAHEADVTRGEKTGISTAISETDITTTGDVSEKQAGKAAPAKKVVKGKKPKMTAKERKERNMELEKIVSYLPLEFRGSDPGLRRNLDAVVEGLMDAPGQTVKLTDLIKPPDLPQARVNKCLIALVNRKIVTKDSSTGQVLYHWQGVSS